VSPRSESHYKRISLVVTERQRLLLLKFVEGLCLEARGWTGVELAVIQRALVRLREALGGEPGDHHIPGVRKAGG
jgi:hypothetical protein